MRLWSESLAMRSPVGIEEAVIESCACRASRSCAVFVGKIQTESDVEMTHLGARSSTHVDDLHG